MRDRLIELLPLLLVGMVLLVYQLTHLGTPLLQFLPLLGSSPTPQAVAVQASPTRATQSRPVATPVASRTPVLAPCTTARPRFAGGLATLQAALGSSMGDPLECEHAINDGGDTQQKTTTGLAYYQRRLNVACFTTGWDHWALTARGLVYWTGDAVDPPGDAALVTR